MGLGGGRAALWGRRRAELGGIQRFCATQCSHSSALPPHKLPAVASAALTPADVDVADIAEAARDGGRPVDFVVREVQARLGAWLHARALVEEAGSRWELAETAPDGRGVRAKLGQVRSWKSALWRRGVPPGRLMWGDAACSSGGSLLFPVCVLLLQR